MARGQHIVGYHALGLWLSARVKVSHLALCATIFPCVHFGGVWDMYVFIAQVLLQFSRLFNFPEHSRIQSKP